MKENYKIYMHKNKINGKVYIGQTKRNLTKRWGRNGIGYKDSPIFWKAIQKYGWDNFEHILIAEDLTKEEANILEKDYIKQYQSTNPNYGYNIDLGGHSSSYVCKKVYQYTFNIQLVKAYDSTAEAERETGFNSAHISDCCNGKRKRVGGYIWSYELLSDDVAPIKRHHNCLDVYQYDLQGNFIKLWNSAVDAGKELNINSNGIIDCCNGVLKTSHGYIWSHEPINFDVRPLPVNLRRNKVYQYNQNNDLIACYNSTLEAEGMTGVSRTCISNCCNHKQRTAGGFVWSYTALNEELKAA